MKKYSATELIVMMEKIEVQHFSNWWSRLKEQLEKLEAAEQCVQRTLRPLGVHSQWCAIRGGDDCDCGANH